MSPSLTRPDGILSLPDELIIKIFAHTTHSRDLSSLCLVNRRLNKLADPILYKSILFKQPANHLKFSESLATTRPRRGSLILNMRLEFPSHGGELGENVRVRESSMSPVDSFSHTISTMSNLETLVISVPASLAHGIGHLFNHPFALACLKWCMYLVDLYHATQNPPSTADKLTIAGSLFYQRDDDGYWDLQENIHIFSHPTLEYLSIRKAKLDERGFDSLERPEMTGLKELHFIDCDINDDALTDILLHPEELVKFTMVQTKAEPEPPLEESPADAGDYIFALNSAQHSLETISIDYATLGGRKALRLRDFVALKCLGLRDYQLFGQTSKTGKPRLHSVGLPPEMETLKFFGEVGSDEEVTELLEVAIRNKAVMARKWKTLVDGGKEGVPASILDAADSVGLLIG